MPCQAEVSPSRVLESNHSANYRQPAALITDRAVTDLTKAGVNGNSIGFHDKSPFMLNQLKQRDPGSLLRISMVALAQPAHRNREPVPMAHCSGPRLMCRIFPTN